MGNKSSNMDEVCKDISYIYANHINSKIRIYELKLLLNKYNKRKEQRFINTCIIDLETNSSMY